MEYDDVLTLKEHPTWRLLMADSAPLMISFFYQTFVQPNCRSMRRNELIAKLEDTLYYLHKIYGEERYPRPAREYLDEWASADHAYLRKYYPPREDEPEYDLTPASEKAIEWLSSLKQTQFIGTESRLLTVFQLLREIVQATETDPEIRIQQLEQQKADIDLEIAKLRQGGIEAYDSTRVKEQFVQADETARRLLSDFRQVEDNFLQLDRRTRERIVVSDKTKGDLLDEIFGEQDAINTSDQGRSFRAFWAFLMSSVHQQEFETLLEAVMSLADIQELQMSPFLSRFKFHLMEAGDKVKTTNARLIEQLRKFLDDQIWLENKRIMGLIHRIEKNALDIKQHPPSDNAFTWVDDVKPTIELPMERTLFQPPQRPVITDQPAAGQADFDSRALYAQHYVDERRLQANIRQALQSHAQISLVDLCQQFPLEKGLSEIVSYLNLASKDGKSLIDTRQTQDVQWRDASGRHKRVTLPTVIFTR